MIVIEKPVKKVYDFINMDVDELISFYLNAWWND